MCLLPLAANPSFLCRIVIQRSTPGRNRRVEALDNKEREYLIATNDDAVARRSSGGSRRRGSGPSCFPLRSPRTRHASTNWHRHDCVLLHTRLNTLD